MLTVSEKLNPRTFVERFKGVIIGWEIRLEKDGEACVTRAMKPKGISSHELNPKSMVTDRVRIQKTTNIVAFLGAGASTPFDYPTTNTFLERFGKAIYEASDKQWGYLNSLRNLYWVKDIENVVEILDSI